MWVGFEISRFKWYWHFMRDSLKALHSTHSLTHSTHFKQSHYSHTRFNELSISMKRKCSFCGEWKYSYNFSFSHRRPFINSHAIVLENKINVREFIMRIWSCCTKWYHTRNNKNKKQYERLMLLEYTAKEKKIRKKYKIK